jgi:hypothetical protein
MAKPKKSASKSKKKTTAKAAKPKAARRAKKQQLPALSTSDVRGMLKPPPDYVEIIDQFMGLWKLHACYIRSGDTSQAQLGAKKRKSDNAWKKEQALQQQQDLKMRPVRDARLRAEADTWSSFLNVWDIAKAVFDDHPEIAADMDPISELLTNAPKPAKKSPPAPPAAS